jgi:hypothetical protein
VPIVGVALATIAETFIFGLSRTSQWNVWSPFIDFTFSNVRPTGTRSIKLPEEATTRGTPRQIVARPIVRLLDLTNFLRQTHALQYPLAIKSVYRRHFVASATVPLQLATINSLSVR